MAYVLYVPELRTNVLSVLVIETKGLNIAFQYGQASIKPRGLTQTQEWFLELERATCIG